MSTEYIIVLTQLVRDLSHYVNRHVADSFDNVWSISCDILEDWWEHT
jgi:hypothetical protein